MGKQRLSQNERESLGYPGSKVVEAQYQLCKMQRCGWAVVMCPCVDSYMLPACGKKEGIRSDGVATNKLVVQVLKLLPPSLPVVIEINLGFLLHL